MSHLKGARETELHAAEECLRGILLNLIKAGLVSTEEGAAGGWRSEAIRLQVDLRTRFGFLSDGDVQLDRIWNWASEEAKRDHVVRTEESLKPILQAGCIFNVRELMGTDLNAEAAAARIRVSAATG